jgi:predicted amidohydrolase
MRIAFVQMDCFLGEAERNRSRAVEMITSAQADLFVLPELFTSGYLFIAQEEVELFAEPIPSGPTCTLLLGIAQKKNCHIVAGLPEKDGNLIYNSCILVGPTGFIATYRKIHLFDEEKLWFAPGNKPFAVYDIGIAKIGMMICFDWIFPESMRSLALAGAEIICHPSNLVLPYCQKAMTTRCLENGVFAVTANRIGSEKRDGKKLHFTGKSQITGPRGKVLSHAGKATEEVGVVEIDPSAAQKKNINKQNYLLQDRRPEMYQL